MTLLFLAAVVAAPPPAIEETRCEYIQVVDGQSKRTLIPQGVLVLSSNEDKFDSSIPDGAAVICGRSTIVPASGDWKVLAAGHVLYLVATDGTDRLGTLEISGGQFRYRLVKGQLSEVEAPQVMERLNAFQEALRGAQAEPSSAQ